MLPILLIYYFTAADYLLFLREISTPAMGNLNFLIAKNWPTYNQDSFEFMVADLGTLR